MNIQKIQRRLVPILQPLAYPYAYIARTRRQLYSKGYKKSLKPRSVTISVGNIAAGGTGKTPLTSWILGWAQKNAFESLVLTRGYGGKTGSYPVIVTASTNASQCGDEPLLLARKHPKTVVIAFPRRKLSMKLAEKYFSPDLVVLDDGMQHLAIQRDIDLVVLKENDLKAGWNRVIPCGEWREDVSALGAAQAFLIKVTPEKFAELQPLLLRRLQHFNRPVFSFMLEVTGLQAIRGFTAKSESADVADVKQPADEADSPASRSSLADFGDYVLAAGVGEPAQVLETATRCLGRPPAFTHFYSDHHVYSMADMTQIQQHGLPVVCTGKDAVKIEQFFLSVPFYYLDVTVSFGPMLMSDTPFEEWLGLQYAQYAKRL